MLWNKRRQLTTVLLSAVVTAIAACAAEEASAQRDEATEPVGTTRSELQAGKQGEESKGSAGAPSVYICTPNVFQGCFYTAADCQATAQPYVLSGQIENYECVLYDANCPGNDALYTC